MNRRLKNYRRFLICFTLLTIVCASFFIIKEVIDKNIPNNIRIVAEEENNLNINFPATATVKSTSNTRLNHIFTDIDLSRSFTVSSNHIGEYRADIKVFGWLKIKSVKITVINKEQVFALGTPAGMIIDSDGVYVLGTGVIKGADGKMYEPSVGIVKEGDYILSANGKEINDKEELIDIVEEQGSQSIKLEIRRDGTIMEAEVLPMKSHAIGEYRLGLWVRDNTQGIGTITFVTKDGEFGALGHGITDVDTKRLLDINGGTLYKSKIMEIIKGRKGNPGEISGVILANDNNKIGEIAENTEYGVFGKLTEDYMDSLELEPVEIRGKQNIKLGKATIRTGISGEMQDYEIEISKIYKDAKDNKSMVVEVVDENLLKITGGIVQGMSGSPILQEGELIGAVTHVFIQDSQKGYATFIENMIN